MYASQVSIIELQGSERKQTPNKYKLFSKTPQKKSSVAVKQKTFKAFKVDQNFYIWLPKIYTRFT